MLCSGPARGRNVTFVRPSEWLGQWEAVDPEEAMRETARRWLHAYGPGTHQEFATWWGWAAGAAGRTFRSLAEELEQVEVDGWRGFALAADVPRIAGSDPGAAVRLLPNFDVYTLGFRPRDRLVAAEVAPRVFRQAGWISPVVLVRGVVAGVWSFASRGRALVVEVEGFRKLSRSVRAGIAGEAARLGEFLGAEASVAYAAR
jgi:hypothetical protein